MLDFLGRSLNERRADFQAVEKQVLAAEALDQHRQRVDTYLRAAKRVLSEPLRVGIVGEVNTGNRARQPDPRHPGATVLGA